MAWKLDTRGGTQRVPDWFAWPGAADGRQQATADKRVFSCFRRPFPIGNRGCRGPRWRR